MIQLNENLAIHPKVGEWLLVNSSQGVALLVEGDHSTTQYVHAQLAFVKQQPKSVASMVFQQRFGKEVVGFSGGRLIQTLIQDLLKNSVLRINSAKTEQEKQAYISLISQMYLN